MEEGVPDDEKCIFVKELSEMTGNALPKVRQSYYVHFI